MPRWLNSLSSVTVATRPDDETLQWIPPDPKLRIVETDVFDLYAASLNKGAALNVAYAHAQPRDWVLAFDADVMPPANWRVIADAEVEPHCLHGCGRDATPWLPVGYFQLWHSMDMHARRWPVFESWWGHCGSYDMNFAEQWPKDLWRELPFEVAHLDTPKRNWFGHGKDANMQALLSKNLKRYRSNPENRLRIPLTSRVLIDDHEHLLSLSRGGPFGVRGEAK
jgi:hypothetical protein